MPDPTSTTPAFSPGPISTCSPSVGRRRRSLRECLYAQCSDHISENIASSTGFGSRSSFSTLSSYSASVSPSSRCGLDEDVTLNMGSHRLEDRQPVRRAGELVDGVLGVGHETEHVAVVVADAGDVVSGPVRVLARGVATEPRSGGG